MCKKGIMKEEHFYNYVSYITGQIWWGNMAELRLWFKSSLTFFSFCFPSSISESFLTVKGAALFLPRGNSPTPNSAPCISQRRNKHTGQNFLSLCLTFPLTIVILRNKLRRRTSYQIAQCIPKWPSCTVQHHQGQLGLTLLQLFHCSSV